MYDLQRIRKLINWCIFQEFGKNDAEIAAALGYTKSSLSQILRGKVPVSKNFVDKLCSLDENINKVWISGKGSMLKNEALLSENISDAPNQFLKGMILKRVGLPLLTVEEATKFPHITEDDPLNTEQFYYIPDIAHLGAHFFIKMSGDSMSPTLNSGDLLACRKVEKEEPIYWGKVYLLSISQGTHVCRIYSDKTNPDQYELTSDNNQTYPSFTCKTKQLHKIFSVVGVVKVI
jgi:SOS-response transcriptional repressor LexA